MVSHHLPFLTRPPATLWQAFYSIYTRLTHEANSPSLSTDCDITGCDVIFTSGAVVWPAVSGIDPPTPNMASSWLPSMFLAPLYHTQILKKHDFLLWEVWDVINNNKIIGWGFCDIPNNQGWGENYQSSQRQRLITLTETLIIQGTSESKILAGSGCFVWFSYFMYVTCCRLALFQTFIPCFRCF